MSSIWRHILIIHLLCFYWLCSQAETSLLQPIKLDNPRDTMSSFMSAMQDYKKGIETNEKSLRHRIDDAVRCLNLKEVPFILRNEKGQEAAIYLKEVIDRVILIDYEKIPNSESQKRWRLKDTEITILQEQEGDNAGEFLFSPQTVYHAKDYYEKVKHLSYLQGSGGGAHFQPNWTEKFVPNWAKQNFWGLPQWKWLGLFLSIFFSFLVKFIGAFLFHLGIKLYGKHEDTFSYHALIAIEKPIGLLLASGFGFLCLNTLALEGFVLSFLVIVLQIILSIGFIWCAYCFSDAISFTLSRIAEKTESDLDDHLVPLLSRSIRVFIVVVGVLVAIQNLGFNVMSILAGLGIGGLAFALAAKDTAANLFGSIMILVDRPFKIGDWIVAGKSEGVVEEIGFRSTRIRTFYNSQISIPNSILANIDIDNMGRRDYRRFKATLGVVYSTSNTQLQSFLLGIREILRKNENVQKDNFQVYFTEYASSSLEILVYCHLKVPSWSDELRVKENILFEIMLLAESLNVVFAFPTRTLYLESFPQSLK